MSVHVIIHKSQVQFLSLSFSFWHKCCLIIDWQTPLDVGTLCLRNPGSTTGLVRLEARTSKRLFSYCNTLLNLAEMFLRLLTKPVADLHSNILDVPSPPPPPVQILSISCNFLEILAKSSVDTPPQESWRPTSGKSWIRHCKTMYKH